jgi:hypothetical protein
MSGPIRRGNGKFPFGLRSAPAAQAGESLQLGAPQVNFLRQIAAVSGLPPAAILNLCIDSAAYHGKAARIDTLLAAWISQAEAQQQAAAAEPPPEPQAPEETVEGTAEDRLKALRDVAQGAEIPGAEETRPDDAHPGEPIEAEPASKELS